VVIIAPGVSADLGDTLIGATLVGLIVVVEHRNHTPGSLYQPSWVDALFEVVFHPHHSGMASREEPLLEPARVLIEPHGLSEATCVEPQASGLRLELPGQALLLL